MVLNSSVSFWSFSTEETPTPSGISNTKRTKVGCTEVRTRIGGRFFASASARCWRNARSATRARSESSLMTSCGRLGGGPVQVSGRKSMKTRSPATMVLIVTLRANDSRIAEPSGSRRADRHSRAQRRTSGRSEYPPGGSNRITRIEPAVVTSDGTSAANFSTSRA